MTPLESKFLQDVGLYYLWCLEGLSIGIFFYGASSSLLIACGLSTSLIAGVFVILFSASVIIFVFVFSFRKVAYFLTRPDPPKSDRRRGFSNRITAVTFAATVINFILCSLNIGTTVAPFIMAIRKVLILDIDYPLLEKPDLINDALRDATIVNSWAGDVPVSSKLLLLDSISIHGWWR